MSTNQERIDTLFLQKTLSHTDWTELFGSYSAQDKEYACMLAQKLTRERFGKQIYFRGIIEYTNICRCNCLYCGIRRENKELVRYRLNKNDILCCCEEGYELGYRTFVIQGGEDPYWNDERLVDILIKIHSSYPDCAITLSLGERSRKSYKKLFDAGADRYLLRHETADAHHFEQLHPANQTLQNRLRCLKDLKEVGYQTGCGMMIGSPYQTVDTLAKDMEFMSEFQPEMVGIGPFIPHMSTPFRDFETGSTELTLFVISLVRLMLPDALIPATTALGTLEGNGRQLGVLAGCNVVMPNLSPASVRKKYMLYNNKAGMENDAKKSIEVLRRQMDEIGYEVVIERGDFVKH